MIIMINGAFGVGKTSTAQLLKSRLPNSMIYDPEEVGYMLRQLLKINDLDVTGDFQHIQSWPPLTVETARQLYQQYQRHLIVPMTLAFPEYFQQIKTGLAEVESDLHHFCLMASDQTLRQRLRERGDTPGGWTEQQMSRCQEAFASPQYEVYVDTDHLNTEAVVEFILARTNLPE